MAKILGVSLPETEKELWVWMQEKISKKELSPSLIFRDALLERKRQEDALSTKNPVVLNDRINNLKQILGRMNGFIDSKKIREEWLKFNESEDSKEKFAKKDIEIIEINKKEVKEK